MDQWFEITLQDDAHVISNWRVGTRLGGKSKTVRLDSSLSALHGGEIRARCHADNECAVVGFVMI